MNVSEEHGRSTLLDAISELRDVALLSLFVTIGIWLSVPELQSLPALLVTFVVATVLIYVLFWAMFFRYR